MYKIGRQLKENLTRNSNSFKFRVTGIGIRMVTAVAANIYYLQLHPFATLVGKNDDQNTYTNTHTATKTADGGRN